MALFEHPLDLSAVQAVPNSCSPAPGSLLGAVSPARDEEQRGSHFWGRTYNAAHFELKNALFLFNTNKLSFFIREPARWQCLPGAHGVPTLGVCCAWLSLRSSCSAWKRSIALASAGGTEEGEGRSWHQWDVGSQAQAPRPVTGPRAPTCEPGRAGKGRDRSSSLQGGSLRRGAPNPLRESKGGADPDGLSELKGWD